MRLPLTPGMSALVRAKMGGRVLRDCVLQAKRFSAEEAETLQIIDRATEPDDLVREAVAMAANLAKYGEPMECYQELKAEMYRDAAHLLQAKL